MKIFKFLGICIIGICLNIVFIPIHFIYIFVKSVNDFIFEMMNDLLVEAKRLNKENRKKKLKALNRRVEKINKKLQEE